MKYLLVTLVSVLFNIGNIQSQKWSIEVTADGYTGNEIMLAYYLGNAQYILDTAQREEDAFIFSGSDTLKSGVYMVVFPPDNQFFQVLIGEGEDDLVIKVSMNDVQHPYQIKGSKETNLFYDYVGFLKAKRPAADSLRKVVDTVQDSVEQNRIRAELRKMDKEVRDYQLSILDKYPESLTALLIRVNLDTETPHFAGTEAEVQLQTYRYVKAHYLDNLPAKDKRLIRTPVLHQRLEYYVNKLTPQVPDSINQSLDAILGKFDRGSEAFQIYLVYYLNQYAKSKIVGMDAVYVHLVDNYYTKGYATWTDSTQLDKIIKNAEILKPLLIGKTAPDLLLLSRDNKPVRLHDVKAPYTVLFFWDPECGHCKKSVPGIIDFYRSYKPKGVEILAVCTQIQDGVPKCWEYIDSHEGMSEWMHAVDPYLRSRFKQIYDVRTTPQIYILDQNKKILMKKIGAEQLGEVMDRLIENSKAEAPSTGLGTGDVKVEDNH